MAGTTVPGVQPFNSTGDMTPINASITTTPSDGTPLANGPCRGFTFAVAGTITIIDPAGNTASFTYNNASVGTIQWIRAAYIKATGTTATGIVALY